MSEFHINVVKLGPMLSHPNAETLNVTKVFDYTVITKKGGFKEGDLVVYVPVDSVVPDTEEWYWLCPLDATGQPRYPLGQVPEKYRVIEAKRLRGIFSQGVLAPLPTQAYGEWREGDDCMLAMGITKYEPPMPLLIGGDNEAAPRGWFMPVYTDVEGMRRHPDVLRDGEEVVITEKIHGANGRFVHDGERVWVGSHTQIKKEDPRSIWWNAYPVVQTLRTAIEDQHSECLLFFGEVYGQVQDLKYGVEVGTYFKCFDVFDVKAMKYLDHDDAVAAASRVGLEWVPILYRGQWKVELNELCEGKSTLADNVREGFVVKPVRERYDDRVGRVILKRHGEGYLLRKKK